MRTTSGLFLAPAERTPSGEMRTDRSVEHGGGWYDRGVAREPTRGPVVSSRDSSEDERSPHQPCSGCADVLSVRRSSDSDSRSTPKAVHRNSPAMATPTKTSGQTL